MAHPFERSEAIPAPERPSLLESAQTVAQLQGNLPAYRASKGEVLRLFYPASYLAVELQWCASVVAYANAPTPHDIQEKRTSSFKDGVSDGILIARPWYSAKIPGLLDKIRACATQIRTTVDASSPDGQSEYFLTQQTRGLYLLGIGEEGLRQAPELEAQLAALRGGTEIAEELWAYYRAGVGAPLYFISKLYDTAQMENLLILFQGSDDAAFERAYQALIQETTD
jgi:hypothetical protein